MCVYIADVPHVLPSARGVCIVCPCACSCCCVAFNEPTRTLRAHRELKPEQVYFGQVSNTQKAQHEVGASHIRLGMRRLVESVMSPSHVSAHI